MTRVLWLVALAGCGPKIDPGPIKADEVTAPVRLLERPDPTAPIVYLQAIVAAGSAHDRPGEEGLAGLTAQALVEAGGGERSKAAVDEAFYPLGTGFEVVVDREWATVRLACPKAYGALCVELFADALTKPRFDEADIVRLREDALYGVTDGLASDEEALAHEVLEGWLYQGHPYGHPVAGRAGVLPTLDRADVQRFFGDTYVRSSVLVGIAGGYDEALRADLTARLAALPGKAAPELVLMAPEKFTGRHLLAVDTETPVTGYALGVPFACDRDDPDWPALFLAYTALGEHRQGHGRLFRNLRTDRGLNYGDYAYLERFVQRGWTSLPEQGVLRSQPMAYAWLRPTGLENGPFLLKIAIDEWERFARDGLAEAEFKDIQAYLGGRLRLLATDPGRRLAYALDAEATGTPNLIEALPDVLAGLDLATVNATIARRVRLEDLRIVAVTGDAEGLVKSLTEDSPTPIVYAEGIVPDEAHAARDAEIANKQLGITADHAKTRAAEGIFQ
jgi:zinc protease